MSREAGDQQIMLFRLDDLHRCEAPRCNRFGDFLKLCWVHRNISRYEKDPSFTMVGMDPNYKGPNPADMHWVS